MEKNILECLLDEECDLPIYLKDENNKDVAYVQIALIPFDNVMYAIVVEKEAFDSGEVGDAGIVLSIDEEKNEVKIVKNVNIINEVFEAYDRLFEEQE